MRDKPPWLPNQLAAIERWPDCTLKPGHPSGPNQLAAIERWPDYTVKPGQPSGPNQLAAIEKWPDLGCPYSLDWTTGLDYWTNSFQTI